MKIEFWFIKKKNLFGNDAKKIEKAPNEESKNR